MCLFVRDVRRGWEKGRRLRTLLRVMGEFDRRYAGEGEVYNDNC